MANDFQVIEEYRARPLNGIWATAPYLHNGSVPDMVELLKPAAQRPTTFYVGNWEFDPARLGFEWSSPFPTAFLFDTRITGNSNAGHEHGTATERGRPACADRVSEDAVSREAICWHDAGRC